MPAWHHTEYSTPICPLTKSTIKKTIYSNARLCQNIQFMDRITRYVKNERQINECQKTILDLNSYYHMKDILHY